MDGLHCSDVTGAEEADLKGRDGRWQEVGSRGILLLFVWLVEWLFACAKAKPSANGRQKEVRRVR